MSQFEHTYKMRVQYHETDQMGVVHHSNYIRWFENGRTEMIREVGISYRKMEDLGLLLPVIDVQVRYHRPARYDDLIILRTKLVKLSPAVMEFSYEVYKDGDEEELLAEGKTKHMWINENWRPTRLNRSVPEIYEKLQALVEK